MLITKQWREFIQADIPDKVRELISQGANWCPNSERELVALRMVNIYNTGYIHGMQKASDGISKALSKKD